MLGPSGSHVLALEVQLYLSGALQRRLLRFSRQPINPLILSPRK